MPSPRRRKIGLFLGRPPYGCGNFQYNLAVLDAVASLPPELYEVVIVYLHEGWLAYLQPYGTPVRRARRTFLPHTLGKCLLLSGLTMESYRRFAPHFDPNVRMLVQENCDLWVFPSQDQMSYKAPVPALVTVHDLMHRYAPQFPEVSAQGEYERRERHYQWIRRFAKGILVHSGVEKQQFVESYGLNPEKAHMLPPVPPKYLQSRTREDIKGRYGLPDKFLFYPAQFCRHKNHQRLVEATAALRERIPDLRLVFVGSPRNGYRPTRELVETLALKDRIHFLGYVPDAAMAGLYRLARALIMPSFFGPTNLPPLEANALGCPVALSDVFGVREIMGEAALYFDPTSVTGIARSMERLWTDDGLCRELSRQGLLRSARWQQGDFNSGLETIIEGLIAADHP